MTITDALLLTITYPICVVSVVVSAVMWKRSKR